MRFLKRVGIEKKKSEKYSVLIFIMFLISFLLLKQDFSRHFMEKQRKPKFKIHTTEKTHPSTPKKFVTLAAACKNMFKHSYCTITESMILIQIQRSDNKIQGAQKIAKHRNIDSNELDT